MAAPHTAGVAALYLEANPGASPAALRDALYGNATKGIVTSSSTGNNHLLYSGSGDGGGDVVDPPNSPPSASFTDSCTALSCSFTDTSSDTDGSIVSWSWDFGDGGTSTEQHPSHNFDEGGTYEVTLTVTDDDGAPSNTASESVTVSDGTTDPPASGISLTVSTYKMRGEQTADLTWSGASTSVDIYRDGSQIATGLPSAGAHTDSTGQKGGGSATYKVCEAGAQTTCSAEVVAIF
jgi:PKD repeat protein